MIEGHKEKVCLETMEEDGPENAVTCRVDLGRAPKTNDKQEDLFISEPGC